MDNKWNEKKTIRKNTMNSGKKEKASFFQLPFFQSTLQETEQ